MRQYARAAAGTAAIVAIMLTVAVFSVPSGPARAGETAPHQGAVAAIAMVHVQARTASYARWYVIRPGDYLSRIAARECGHADYWHGLYESNRARLGSDPNMIFPDRAILIACYRTSLSADPPRVRHITRHTATASVAASFGGTLSYAGLEQLWRAAGGASWAAQTAACIAEHESSGRQYAVGPAGERGYWQIHPDHGALSTFNAYGNARAAIIISGDGTNWSAWTTAGMCGV